MGVEEQAVERWAMANEAREMGDDQGSKRAMGLVDEPRLSTMRPCAGAGLLILIIAKFTDI